jgi:hypothetical protein
MSAIAVVADNALHSNYPPQLDARQGLPYSAGEIGAYVCTLRATALPTLAKWVASSWSQAEPRGTTSASGRVSRRYLYLGH